MLRTFSPEMQKRTDAIDTSFTMDFSLPSFVFCFLCWFLFFRSCPLYACFAGCTSCLFLFRAVELCPVTKKLFSALILAAFYIRSSYIFSLVAALLFPHTLLFLFPFCTRTLLPAPQEDLLSDLYYLDDFSMFLSVKPRVSSSVVQCILGCCYGD